MVSREAVVLVHGIWMTGLDLVLLRHRLRACGYDASIFTYPSLRSTPAENARRLHERLRTIRAERVHLVGHSLGGLTILHFFERFAAPLPGRVVLLGSPVQGSGVARVLASRHLTSFLVGQSGVRGLLGDVPTWAGGRDLGTIAGDLGLGVGRILGGVDGPNDGTVAVRETELPGATDALVLPVTHTGLLLAPGPAEYVARFLCMGRFDAGETAPAQGREG